MKEWLEQLLHTSIEIDSHLQQLFNWGLLKQFRIKLQQPQMQRFNELTCADFWPPLWYVRNQAFRGLAKQMSSFH
jgi:hypothetical protein